MAVWLGSCSWIYDSESARGFGTWSLCQVAHVVYRAVCKGYSIHYIRELVYSYSILVFSGTWTMGLSLL